MKKMKKVLSMLLAVIMVLAMAAPSFAREIGADEKGTITIGNAVEGQKYSIYKLFNLTSYDDTTSLYNYQVTDNKWIKFMNDYKDGKVFTVNADGILTENKGLKEDADRKEFAKAALEYAKSNGIAVAKEPITAGKDKVVIFTDCTLGYYLLDSTTGTVCSLDTMTTNITIEDKNKAPQVDKKRTDANGVEATDKSVAIGDTVYYSIKLTAEPGAQSYKLSDKMPVGLTYNNNAKVVNVEKVEIENTDNINYTVNNTPGTNFTFKVEFTDNFCKAITKETIYYITYSAVVNEEAIQKDENGNPVINPITNEAKLEYGDNEVTTTTTETLNSYMFDLVKTNVNKEILSGAEFSLFDDETEANKEDGTAIYLIKDDAKGCYRIAKKDAQGTPESGATTTIEAGNVVIAGLKNGNYYLKETKAPTGYNKLTDLQKVEISNGNIKAVTTQNEWVEGGIHVINNTGTILPSTGGIGTTIFYAVGIILMAGAVFFVVRRKRA